MPARYHSVTLNKDLCRGCSDCLMHCPTQAIRVRAGRAHIIKELCIDCGACIRYCNYHAKVALTQDLSSIERFEHRIALPAPSFFAQFDRRVHGTGQILDSLKALGFQEVFEVARGADIVTQSLRDMLQDQTLPRPLISSACPAVTRIIQIRCPSLLRHIVPLRQPMDVAASMARRDYARRLGVKPDEIGLFFITPCPAKVTAIRNPLGHERSDVDGAISIRDVYKAMQPILPKHKHSPTEPVATPLGIGWALNGGESEAALCVNSLAVDGIDNVIHVLEELENGRLSDLDFLEAAACPGGCVGGPLVFGNSFIARNTLRAILRDMPPQDPSQVKPPCHISPSHILNERSIEPNCALALHEDMDSALDMMEEIQEVLLRLPGHDCGACGSPTCATFAEDVIRGYCRELDCVYRLKESLQQQAEASGFQYE